MQAGIETITQVEQLIEPTLNDLGFDLVLVRMIGGARRTLQVMAEPLDRERTMDVEDCAEISHALSAVLDVADPVPGRYSLEVSSPGLDRPLVRAGDFERFAGYVAKIEIDGTIDGRKRFKGRLAGVVENGSVRLQMAEDIVDLPLTRIRKARLELTDELIEASRKGSSAANGEGRRHARS